MRGEDGNLGLAPVHERYFNSLLRPNLPRPFFALGSRRATETPWGTQSPIRPSQLAGGVWTREDDGFISCAPRDFRCMRNQARADHQGAVRREPRHATTGEQSAHGRNPLQGERDGNVTTSIVEQQVFRSSRPLRLTMGTTVGAVHRLRNCSSPVFIEWMKEASS